jgi:SCP-2 sterol transfer family
LATKRQVESKLRELITRMDQADQEVGRSLSKALPDARIIEVTIPDLGATYWTELSNGKMHGLREGRPDEADIRVRVESDHLMELVDGKKSLFSSYLGGRVKIEASLSDLLRLQRMA